MKKIICWLQGHDFAFNQSIKPTRRECLRCGLEQYQDWGMFGAFGWEKDESRILL